MSYIKIENYTKKIKKNIVLNCISLNLEKNKIYGFVGINGSGKTMLFRAISGLIKPTSGTVVVDNIEIKNGHHPENLGLLIENADFWNELSAFENLNVLNHMSKSKLSKEEIFLLIDEFGLDSKSEKPYSAFSLGMKQKLRLIQAFMNNPDLIILDEPTNALDEKSILNLRKRILKEKSNGKTILIASHSKEEIQELCVEIIFIESGKIKDIIKVER